MAQFIAGVLGHETLVRVMNELSASADLKPGDRVKTTAAPASSASTR